MVVTQRGYVSAEQIAAEIERARQKLGPEVVRFRHSIGPNHYDETAIHIRIVLTDAASLEANLVHVTGQITSMMFDEVQPSDWGMRMYFSFRSESEQAKRNDLDLIQRDPLPYGRGSFGLTNPKGK